MILRIDPILCIPFLLAAVAVATAAHAGEGPVDCKAIDTDAERLACYDRAANRGGEEQKIAAPGNDTSAANLHATVPATPPSTNIESYLLQT